jgi:hypothetical protein
MQKIEIKLLVIVNSTFMLSQLQTIPRNFKMNTIIETMGVGLSVLVPAQEPVLVGNAKRKASCKKVGGEKKRAGHKIEDIFNEQFGKISPTTYKAEADCTISAENANGLQLMTDLQAKFGEIDNYNLSVKSGENLQFVLGRIDEITGAANAEEKLQVLGNEALWKKYLGKGNSERPAGWLIYRNTNNSWSIFKMSEVIAFIVEKCKWRALETGRFKGDFENDTKKGFSQYLTYEYRETHKSHFLGANGGKGKQLMELLKKKITCHHVNDPVVNQI